MARKEYSGSGFATDNLAASAIDKGAFFWVQNCGICHPGGGPGELDRGASGSGLGRPYARFSGGAWGLFGNDPTGLAVSPSVYMTHGDNTSGVSGDYAFVNPQTFALQAAPWQVTGVSEADCLMCHLPGFSWDNRSGALLGGAGVRALDNSPVAAFAAASTAGAGFVDCVVVVPVPGTPFRRATTLNIRYLQADLDGLWERIVREVPDANCRGCHAIPDARKAGRSWESDTDAHKARAVACVHCHPAGRDRFLDVNSGVFGKDLHEIAKGNITIGSVRDDADDTMYSCRECHVDRRDPASPDPATAHAAFPPVHFAKLSCNVCHIPYLEDSKLTTGTPLASEIPDLVIDYSKDGTTIIYKSTAFLSNNQVDPKGRLAGVDNTRWYPGLFPHEGAGGVIKTVKPLVIIWWGLWDNATPAGPTAVVKPVILRNLRRAIDNTMKASLADANGDGIAEVNTEAEILTYIDALSSPAKTDHFGQPVVPPGFKLVLVKSGRVYFKDDATGRVDFFESPVAECPEFAVNHNVRPSYQALGANGCQDCHTPGSPFFFRKELLDPFGLDNRPVYLNAFETMGYTAGQVDALTRDVPEPSAPDAGSSECFIATAAYGTPYESHVRTLRRFREICLMPHAAGRLAVKAYYAVSPPIAAAVAGSATLKALVRAVLAPVVLGAAVLVDGTAAAKAGLLVVLGLLGISLFLVFRRLATKTT